MSFQTNRSVVRSWRIALLAGLVFACSQLVFAGHQFEHDSHASEEVCAACLQVQQLDDVAPGGDCAPLPAPAAEHVQFRPTAVVEHRDDAAPYSTRAPPEL